jgi:hypothetical protein
MSVQQKPGQPAVGFNHNIAYKGRTFHVQTEDSGPSHGHYVTHVFMGGNILASVKGSYAEQLPEWAPTDVFAEVRRRMEDQHKAMLRALLAGAHDPEIERRTSGAVYEPGVLADGERGPGLLVGGAPKSGAPAGRPGEPAPHVAARPTLPTPLPRPSATASSSAPSTRAPAEPSLFGEGLVSERRLDEVILSYLAADLENSRK